jgi:hypothetical protein
LGYGQRSGKYGRGQQTPQENHTLGKETFNAADFLGTQLTGTAFNGSNIDGGHDQFLFCRSATLHGPHFNYFRLKEQSSHLEQHL